MGSELCISDSKYGMTIVVWYDGRRTICGRHVMVLWHTFCCFHEEKPMLPC